MQIKIDNPKNIYELCFLLIALPVLFIFILLVFILVVLVVIICMPLLIGIGIYYLIKLLLVY